MRCMQSSLSSKVHIDARVINHVEWQITMHLLLLLLYPIQILSPPSLLSLISPSSSLLAPLPPPYISATAQ